MRSTLRFTVLFLTVLLGAGWAWFHVWAENPSGAKQVYSTEEVPDENKTDEQILIEKGVMKDAAEKSTVPASTASGSGNEASSHAVLVASPTMSRVGTEVPSSATPATQSGVEAASYAVPAAQSGVDGGASTAPAVPSSAGPASKPGTLGTGTSSSGLRSGLSAAASRADGVPSMKAVEVSQQIYNPEEVPTEKKTDEQVLTEKGVLKTAPLDKSSDSGKTTGVDSSIPATGTESEVKEAVPASTSTEAGTNSATPVSSASANPSTQETSQATTAPTEQKPQAEQASRTEQTEQTAPTGQTVATTERSAGAEAVAAAPVTPATPAGTAGTEKKKDSAEEVKRLKAQQQLTGPKSLILYFLDAAQRKEYDEAAWAIDFTNHEDLRLDEREELAYKLDAILIRLDNFRVADLPEDYDRPNCVLWPDQQYKAIALIRLEDRTWRFSSSMIAHIPEFYDQIITKAPSFARRGWLQHVPSWMSSWLFIPVWGLLSIQWLLLLGFVLLGILVVKLLPKLMLLILHWFFKRSNLEQVYQDMLRSALRPLAYLVMLHIWYGGLLFVQASPVFQRTFDSILRPLGIGIVILSLLRFIDLFGEWWRAKIKQKSLDSTLNLMVGLCDGVLKVIVVCVGGIFIAQIFGFSAYGILSGMGIGGIAVALAAQQTLSNFFGSLTILMDRPFTVGDTIIVDGIQGTVESVGLRSTRIRTLEDTHIIMPNSTLASCVINNMGRRITRRFRLTLGLQYDTPLNLLRAFRIGVRKIVEAHPLVQKKDLLVSIHNLGDSSINIELLCFIKVHDAQQEYAVREALILDILLLAEELGVSLAFPTQTNYMIQTKETSYPRATEVQTPDAARELGETTAAQVLERKKQ